MLSYRITEADRRSLPPAYSTQPRYLGYHQNDSDRPFARYFTPAVRPIQDHVRDSLLAGQSPAEYGYEVDDAPRRLAARGYHDMETGWTRTASGALVVSCLTDMPGVTAAMWDWWFGWHGTDSARYKLWHPGAHQFSAMAEDRNADRSLTDRQRFIGNVSFVDEYIGATLNRLAIRFVDPVALGFAEHPGTTHICARVCLTDLPVAVGWLIHQVRPTEHGSEMRSRFFLGHPEVFDLPNSAVSHPIAGRVLTHRATRRALTPAVNLAAKHAAGSQVGHYLLHHCASEMHHLAAFLPQLYAEFRDTP